MAEQRRPQRINWEDYDVQRTELQHRDSSQAGWPPAAERDGWTAGGTPAGTAKIREAVEARDALADALSRAGIQLPAMDVRTPWGDVVDGTDDDASEALSTDSGRAARYALVHLGVCSAPVAFALAAVIARGSGQ